MMKGLLLLSSWNFTLAVVATGRKFDRRFLAAAHEARMAGRSPSLPMPQKALAEGRRKRVLQPGVDTGEAHDTAGLTAQNAVTRCASSQLSRTSVPSLAQGIPESLLFCTFLHLQLLVSMPDEVQTIECFSQLLLVALIRAPPHAQPPFRAVDARSKVNGSDSQTLKPRSPLRRTRSPESQI